jgi:hypothetical protein
MLCPPVDDDEGSLAWSAFTIVDEEFPQDALPLASALPRNLQTVYSCMKPNLIL